MYENNILYVCALVRLILTIQPRSFYPVNPDLIESLVYFLIFSNKNVIRDLIIYF